MADIKNTGNKNTILDNDLSISSTGQQVLFVEAELEKVGIKKIPTGTDRELVVQGSTDITGSMTVGNTLLVVDDTAGTVSIRGTKFLVDSSGRVGMNITPSSSSALTASSSPGFSEAMRVVGDADIVGDFTVSNNATFGDSSSDTISVVGTLQPGTVGAGFLPVGGVIATLHHLTGAHNCTNTTTGDVYGLVQCNGQTINDPESPMDGVQIPLINNDVFIMGNTTSSETVGGTNNYSLNVGQLPPHTHEIDHDHVAFNSGNQNVNHTHEMDHSHETETTTSFSGAQHSHEITLNGEGESSSANLSHSHNASDDISEELTESFSFGFWNEADVGFEGSFEVDIEGRTAVRDFDLGTVEYDERTVVTSSSLGNHSHNFNIEGEGNTDDETTSHSHGLSINFNGNTTGNNSNHSHTVDVPPLVDETSTVGSGNNIENRPQYISSRYCMRIK